MNRFAPILILLTSFFSMDASAQCTGWTDFQLVTDTFTNPAFGVIITVERDKTGKPFVYLAAKDAGIKIYDISDPGIAVLAATIPTSHFSGFDAINLFQDSVYLYVSLGDTWNTEEESGMAIIDVSNPFSPVVLDHYTLSGSQGGAGCVVVKEPYAYLGAMRNGLIILNIADKKNIQFESQLVFSNDFPHQMVGGIGMYNARGIDIKDEFAYICYDRGGLRIVNIEDVSHPVEINQYCFGPLVEKATAYNNIVIDNNLAFVAIDYYGMEILDITDPMNIAQLGWWHPETWADTTNEYSVWANSQGHANELAYDPACKIVYVAAGKSDVVAISVAEPSNPITCQTYGSVTDSYGTWGLDLFYNRVYIAYIWTFIFPPFSNYTGFAELAVDTCSTTRVKDPEHNLPFRITPNPFSDEILIALDDVIYPVHVDLLNTVGQFVSKYTFTSGVSASISFNGQAGVYWLRVMIGNQSYVIKLIKN